MAKRKTPIPENETYILPSSNEEMEKFVEKFRIDMTEHIVSSIEFAIDNKSPIIEVFQFKNSDYVITIAEKDYDLNLTHIHDLYNKFKLYELCPRIEKIKDKLKKNMSKKNKKLKNDKIQNSQENPTDKTPVIFQRNKLKSALNIFKRSDLTPRQKEFLELVANKEVKMIFVSGPAGSAKTFLSIMAALQLLSDKKVSDIIYARSIVECSDKSLGALPGTIDDKVHVYLQPLIDKMEELLPRHEIEMLNKDKRITGMPISYLRGLNFNAKAIIGDEFQNCTYKEILTFITRTGEFSKVLVLGDIGQSDINGKSGFEKMMNLFDGENHRKNGIYVFKFTIEDCVRSGLVKHILKTIEEDKLKNPK